MTGLSSGYLYRRRRDLSAKPVAAVMVPIRPINMSREST
jgi:hypothetical protein